MSKENRAILLLEDGTVFEGEAMGFRGKAMGNVAFNTSMVGYQEALTTPANRGLLLTQTFPLIGNYGVNCQGWESERVHAAGYIVREHCAMPSNYLSEGSLAGYLEENQVVGICGIDTRRLTRLIRERGELKGMVVSTGTLDIDALLAELRAYIPEPPELSSLSGSVAAVGGDAVFRVGVVDFGVTNSVLRALIRRGMKLSRYGARQLETCAKEPLDGIILSDGPGDPREYRDILPSIRALCQKGIPILGLSLGHQLLALANGMGVECLKCGHRGANQPVRSLLSGRTYITAQNHVFAVDESTVNPELCDISFMNANDRTCEGLDYKKIPVLSVQFLPDAEAHTHSTAFIYDEFVQMMKNGRENGDKQENRD